MCGFRFSENTESQVKVNISPKSVKLVDPGPDLAETLVRYRNLTSEKPVNDPSLRGCEDVGPHEITVVGKGSNSLCSYSSRRQVCVSKREMKNLSHQRTRIEKRAAGAIRLYDADIKGKLVEFAWWMKKQGYAESTIESRDG